jgi:hypothetical protein
MGRLVVRLGPAQRSAGPADALTGRVEVHHLVVVQHGGAGRAAHLQPCGQPWVGGGGRMEHGPL